MLKKIYQKLALAAVLLLTVAAMLGTVIQAASTDVYVVTIDYKTSECTVTVTVDGKVLSANDGTAGEYHIPKNHATVSIQIIPKIGYEVSALTDRETNKALVSSNTDGDTYEPILTKDMSYYVTGTAKNYTIKEIAAAGMTHTEVFGTMEYQYDSEETVSLPIPTLEGYNFTGWKIYDNADVSFQLSTITGNAVIFPTSSYPTVGDVLFAEPMWVGTPQPVTRLDLEYGSTIPVNYGNNGVVYTTTWQEPNGTTGITGLDGNDTDADLNKAGTVKATFDEEGYKIYVGYEPFAKYASNSEYYSQLAKVKTDADANKIYRYYTPITYTLTYEGIGDTSAYPKTHVYNTETSFEKLQPEKVGYIFAGWKVYIVKNDERVDVTSQINSEVTVIKNLKLEAREMCLAEGNTANEIILEANWTPETYGITYDWACTDTVEFDTDKYGEIVYDSELKITELPVRVGYNFEGWTLTTADDKTETISVEDGKTVIHGKYASDITLTAVWSPKKFAVTLDGNGADSTDHTASIEATFDAALTLPTDFKAPSRVGHTFLGYSLDKDGTTLYIKADINEDGSVTLTSLVDQWKIDEDTTLYAQWSVNSYKVTVDIDTENTTVTIIDADENGRYDYGEEITIRIEVLNKYKLVKWEGVAVDHTTTYEYKFTLGPEDRTLTGVVLPAETVPAFVIDYIKEVITTDTGAIRDGHYLITCDGEQSLDVVVNKGMISVNGANPKSTLSIPEAYFGKTLKILVYGVDGNTANSDVISLTVEARPAMPEMNTATAEIKHVYQYEETQIVIEMTDLSALSQYEFACSENADSTGLIWWSVANADERYFVVSEDGKVMFVNLKPGASYYVFVRVKAVEDDHAHGVEFRTDIDTHSDNTLEAKKNAMLDLITDTDGEMVKALIDQAIKDANELVSPSPDFYNNLEAIYNRVLAGIEFARTQDARIAELKALQDSLIASGEFSNDNVNLINNICEAAVQTVKNATAVENVQSAYESGMSQMRAVPVTYLVYGDMELTAKDGLDQGTALYQDRNSNIADLTNAVDTAIQTGKFAYGGSAMTQAQVAEALKSLDVMAAYQMRLTDAQNVTVTPDGNFVIRLLLPNELRNVSGLQVAYYNEKTGELEVLDTEKDGNCVVFYASHIDDFVILGDPTMNLTGFIVALGLILACQLIGIILLLVRRAKYAKSVRRYSLALPALLTIRFLPDNGMTILFVLGGLVVLFQIVLMYLLLSSEVVYHQKHKRRNENKQAPAEDVPAMAEQPEESYNESSYGETTAVLTALSEEHAEEEADEELEDTEDDTDSDRALSEEDAVEQTEEDMEMSDEVYEEAVAEDAEAYDDFIEPAANPRYSLPDEAFEGYAVNDELTEEELPADEEYAADETYTEDTSDEVETTAWDYDDEATAETEEGSEWQEESAEWQYDESPEDIEDGSTQAFDTETYDTEAYAENGEYVQTEEVYSEDGEYAETEEVYAEDGAYSEAEDVEVYAEADVYDENPVYDENAAYDENAVYDETEEVPADTDKDEEPKPYDGYEE